MDVVEAIDAWIDERIDDLSDDELEQILEILDAVSASELADLETNHVYNDDVYALVELVGGTPQEQALTEDVLRAAFFGDPLPADLFPDEDLLPDTDETEQPDETDETDDDIAAGPEEDTDTDTETDTVQIGGTSALVEDEVDEEPVDEEPVDEVDEDSVDEEPVDEVDEEPVDKEPVDEDPVDDVHDADFLTEVANAAARDDQLHSDFLADLEQADTTASSSELARPVAPVELRTGDALGPSFLTETPVEPTKPGGRWQRWAVAVFLIGGLAVFAFGSLQLLSSLREPAPDTSTAAAATAAPDPTATALPTATPEPTPTAGPVDPDAPTPTPTPIPTPPARIGIRLVTGDVMVASFNDLQAVPDLKLVYDASDDDLVPARNVVWLDDVVGVIDADGSVLTINPDTSRPRPILRYEAGGGLSEALEIAPIDDKIVVRTDDGDITLIPDRGRADPDVIEFIWDADEEEVAATDIAAVGDLVPFVLEDGNARVIDTTDDNSVSPIWLAEDQPPAFNVGASESGILLGVGQGAVARYRLDDSDEPFDSVWNPFEEEEAPAIGYAYAGDRTAVVLGDGAIVLADDTGTGPRVWDPEETEIRALALEGGPGHVVVLLESGSVVRIPLSPDEFIASIWDITDETLAAANQISVETLASE